MVNLSANFEASLAELLAQLLDDEEIWSIGQKPPDDPDQRERLAAHALTLYDYTAPLVAERGPHPSTPVDTAVYVLRMLIGDRCAVLSYDWDMKNLRLYPHIPTRSAVERLITLFGVQEWAAAHDHPLSLTADDGDKVRPLRGLWRARMNKKQLASAFCTLDRAYETVQRQRKEWPVWVTRRPVHHQAAAGFLAASQNALFIFGTAKNPGAYSVATATEMLAQGIFVVTHASSEVDGFFPSRAHLREYLHATEGYSWLARHAKELPGWLKGHSRVLGQPREPFG